MRRHLFIFSVLFAVSPLIVAAQVVTVTPEELYAGGPSAPMIRSVDYPDSERWYQAKEATFAWTLPVDVTAVSTDVVMASTTEPMTPHRPPISNLTIPATSWKEGEQYVSVQFRNTEKWGQFATYKVSIDNTPPDPFVIKVAPHGGSRGAVVSFETTDELSGISHYEVSLNDVVSVQIPPEEARRGYFATFGSEGVQRLKVTAYDRAGNHREAETSVLPILAIPETSQPESLTDYAAQEPASLLVGLMSALLIVMFGYLVYERQRYASGLSELRQETDEVHTQMLKVFSALREEIYDQINAINRRPKLTKKEQIAVDGLEKALAVSEELLEKEIKDVKKIIN